MHDRHALGYDPWQAKKIYYPNLSLKIPTRSDTEIYEAGSRQMPHQGAFISKSTTVMESMMKYKESMVERWPLGEKRRAGRKSEMLFIINVSCDGLG